MRVRIIAAALTLGLLLGCAQGKVPERSAVFRTRADIIKAYWDYRRLERAGVEVILLKNGEIERPVSLPYYLFVIARAFETAGRNPDALKLYLRLLTHFPLLYQESQLGTRVENRLYYLLGDRSWVQPSAMVLSERLSRAFHDKDLEALQGLISRDFGFGASEEERLAVHYREGLALVQDAWRGAGRLTVEFQPARRPGEAVLRVTGWADPHRVWYLLLHQTRAPAGWEWDTVFWEDRRPNVDKFTSPR